MIEQVRLTEVVSNPFQNRKDHDTKAIEALAAEIDKTGFWGGLRGRRRKGKVELTFGHRRIEALRHAGWKEVEIDLLDLTDDQMALQWAAENFQRTDLDPLEKARAVTALHNQLKESHGLTDKQACKEVAVALGYEPGNAQWFQECVLVTSFKDSKAREAVRQIGVSTAALAQEMGGEDFVIQVAEQQVPKGELRKIVKALKQIKGDDFEEAPEKDKAVREKVFRSVESAMRRGKFVKHQDVVKSARALFRKEHSAPPDINEIAIRATLSMESLREEVAGIFKPHKSAISASILRDLISAAKELTEELNEFASSEQRQTARHAG